MNYTRPLNPDLMHAPRASKNTLTPPEKGVLIKEPATCSQCYGKCTIGGMEKEQDGYYTFYTEKLCKMCAMRNRVV